MLRKLILKDTVTGRELILPVTPHSWQGEAGRKANSLTMHTAGAINLPGNKILLDEEIDCLLPAKEYAFNQPGTITDPWHYLEQLIRWSDEGTVLRFIVSGTSVNEEVILDPIRYREQDGTNDIYCTIPLRGHRTLVAETTESTASQNSARAVEAPPTTQATYTIVAGDTLSAIARRFYGDASLYPKLAVANGIKNAHLIYPGQVLKLPGLEQLPAAGTTRSGAVLAKTEEAKATVKLQVEYSGSKACFGAVVARYPISDSSAGTRTLSSRDSFFVQNGGLVQLTWSTKGKGRSDYCVLNGQQINARSVNYEFTVKADSKLYIHWTEVEL